jgi:hypothetical protein
MGLVQVKGVEVREESGVWPRVRHSHASDVGGKYGRAETGALDSSLSVLLARPKDLDYKHAYKYLHRIRVVSIFAHHTIINTSYILPKMSTTVQTAPAVATPIDLGPDNTPAFKLIMAPFIPSMMLEIKDSAGVITQPARTKEEVVKDCEDAFRADRKTRSTEWKRWMDEREKDLRIQLEADPPTPPPQPSSLLPRKT